MNTKYPNTDSVIKDAFRSDESDKTGYTRPSNVFRSGSTASKMRSLVSNDLKPQISHRTADILARSQSVDRPSRNFLRRIFRSSEQHMIDLHNNHLHEITFSNEEEQYKAVCNALLTRLEHQAGAWLAMCRQEQYAAVTTFSTEKLGEVKRVLEQAREENTALLRARKQRLESNQDMEILVESEVQDIQQDIADFLGFLRELEIGYTNAMRAWIIQLN